jgi:hypothetical protein
MKKEFLLVTACLLTVFLFAQKPYSNITEIELNHKIVLGKTAKWENKQYIILVPYDSIYSFMNRCIANMQYGDTFHANLVKEYKARLAKAMNGNDTLLLNDTIFYAIINTEDRITSYVTGQINAKNVIILRKKDKHRIHVIKKEEIFSGNRLTGFTVNFYEKRKNRLIFSYKWHYSFF